jgi:fructokinase
VHRGALLDGPLGIGGEWGHNPLPWMTADEFPGPECWCGRLGCLETFVSGTGLAADHARVTGRRVPGEEIVAAARLGEVLTADILAAGGSAVLQARGTLQRHADRLARGLAHVVNLFDPHVIVLGGGLSGLGHLYTRLQHQVPAYILSDRPAVDIRPPRWGAASGVRGAARLWDGG